MGDPAWRQRPDGTWYQAGQPPPPPAPPAPPGAQASAAPNETRDLLRAIAKDMATVRAILSFWTLIYLLAIVLAFLALTDGGGL